MSRYIEADKTLAYISRILGGLPLALLIECEKNGIDIVRCKECNAYMTDGYADGCGFCAYHHSVVQADDFCSYGEREGE